jgi:hypothetical protein
MMAGAAPPARTPQAAEVPLADRQTFEAVVAQDEAARGEAYPIPARGGCPA